MEVYAAALKQYRQAPRLRIFIGIEVLSPHTKRINEILVSHLGLRGLYVEAVDRSHSVQNNLRKWKAALMPLKGTRVEDELYFAFKIYCHDENQRRGWIYSDREVREEKAMVRHQSSRDY